MLTLYGNGWSGPTYKVALMLAMCDQPYDYRHVDLETRENREPWYYAKSRYGQVPCLEDTTSGRTLVQSPIILDYLAETFKRFRGQSDDERQQIHEWFFWEFDRLAPYIYRPRGCAKGYLKASPEILTDFTRIGTRGLKVLDKHLDKRTWMVGAEPTIADIDIYGVIAFAREAFFDLEVVPAVGAFMSRVEALPGYAPYSELIPNHSRAAKEVHRHLRSRMHPLRTKPIINIETHFSADGERPN